ncbi:MAG: Nif3-like dinuclear metal center hexameric protein [Gammaproteobacteria bacterium]
MISRNELLKFINQLLKPELIADYCPNGLQVSGKSSISTLVTGVTACEELLTKAIELKADAILVHHGYFWKNEDPCIVRIKQKRLKLLLENDINLLAYHLPLDVHPEFGNNTLLAENLSIVLEKRLSVGGVNNLLCYGVLSEPISPTDFSRRIAQRLKREPLHIAANKKEIKNVAWCTGAAQDYLSEVIQLNCDAYITGEISERSVYIARESNIHFYAAGHHATERYGVQALGNYLSKEFGLVHHYVELDNPV